MIGEGFLTRWSRRKRGEVEAPPEALPEALPIAPPAAAPSAEPAPAFDPASLPPVESLTELSDFTAFLRQGVPPLLRQAALRRAWLLDPDIRSFVGPADYAWDYNAVAGVPGFSLDLGGDVQRLLAQAIGLERDAEATAKAAAKAGVPEVAAEIADREPPAFVPPAAATPPASETAPPHPRVADAEAAAPLRRHGSAQPV